VLLATVALLGPEGVRGQEPEPPPGPSTVRPWARASVASTHLDGRRRTLLGGRLGLALDSRYVIGGGVAALDGSLAVAESPTGAGFDVDLGYGGAILGYRPFRTRTWAGEATLLLGAGHARATDRLVESNLEADNFFVAAPEFSLVWRPVRWFGLLARASFRLIAGVDDLPGLDAGSLDGATFGAGLQLGH